MPEGPEVAHSRDRIKQLLIGQFVEQISIGESGRYAKKHPDGFSEFISIIKKEKIKVFDVASRGKLMYWVLKSEIGREIYLHSHFGMSGGWFVEPSKHTSIYINYSQMGTVKRLFFNDPRRFGTIKFLMNTNDHEKKLKTLGPCVLSGSLTSEIFAKNILRKPTRTIAEALMDQSVVAGVGNYLRAEILFDCGVDPLRNVTEITSKEYVKLCEATIRIARSSYESHGASIKTYRSVDGSAGTTQINFRVYGCKVCPSGHEITRSQDGNGRMMHWCSSCQR